MAFEDIKDNLDDIRQNSEELVNTSLDYYRLWGFKVTAKAGSQFMTLLLLALFMMMALLLFSLCAAYALAEYFGSNALGFLIMGTFYLVITFIAYLFRKPLVERPFIKKLSEIIFND
ncbi:phage holin family protein [Myroides sp. N17-2]|uniref:phage holin family protein n=1 Tax=Myroides sp. N17-2 TaxID=2030799 RepID=UPI000EFD3D86|nr:phage holin family protein [Myroides sp. N17-2]